MKNIHAKLITLALGFLFLMMMKNLLHAVRGGSECVDCGLKVSGGGHILMGRKLNFFKPVGSETKKRSRKGLVSTNSAREVDNLMRGDYPSRVRGRKRTPIHN